MSDCANFFRDNNPPENLPASTTTMREFCQKHAARKIVLVTSGKLTQ
jgi:hypothetical protein